MFKVGDKIEFNGRTGHFKGRIKYLPGKDSSNPHDNTYTVEIINHIGLKVGISYLYDHEMVMGIDFIEIIEDWELVHASEGMVIEGYTDKGIVTRTWALQSIDFKAMIATSSMGTYRLGKPKN